FLDQADDAPVADPVLQEADQPLLTDRVKERPDVGVDDVAHLLAVNPNTERIQRVMRAAPGPESIREPEEVFLVDRVQQRDRRPLDNLVLQGCDREWAPPTIRFGNIHGRDGSARYAPRCTRSCRSSMLRSSSAPYCFHVSRSTPGAAFRAS